LVCLDTTAGGRPRYYSRTFDASIHHIQHRSDWSDRSGSRRTAMPLVKGLTAVKKDLIGYGVGAHGSCTIDAV